MRPTLTTHISLKDFQEFYWLKKELQDFCRRHGIGTSGSKEELTSRVVAFLRKEDPTKFTKPTRSKKKTSPPKEPTLDTLIEENLTCTQNLRAFFVSVVGPSFTFSVVFQKFLKQNVGKTYRNALNFWKGEQKRKKDPSHITVIAPQFEYNQFIRNFFANPENIGKMKKEAIKAWVEFRDKRRVSGKSSTTEDVFHSAVKLLIFTEGTILMHAGGMGRTREERVRQVEDGEISVHDFASYIPIGNAVKKLKDWNKQGAKITYLTSRQNHEEIETIRALLSKYEFPQGELFFRKQGEQYKDIAEQFMPDFLIEDDCESIGGVAEMTYTHIDPEKKKKITSVPVKEFGGIDQLPDDIRDLSSMPMAIRHRE